MPNVEQSQTTKSQLTWFSPATIQSDEPTTAQAMSTFMLPFLQAMGVIIPSGANPSVFKVTFNLDGSSQTEINFASLTVPINS